MASYKVKICLKKEKPTPRPKYSVIFLSKFGTINISERNLLDQKMANLATFIYPEFFKKCSKVKHLFQFEVNIFNGV